MMEAAAGIRIDHRLRRKLQLALARTPAGTRKKFAWCMIEAPAGA